MTLTPHRSTGSSSGTAGTEKNRQSCPPARRPGGTVPAPSPG